MVDVADVPPSCRLLKKLSSRVLSRHDYSTYRIVRLAVTSPSGLAGKLFEQPVVCYPAREQTGLGVGTKRTTLIVD